MPEGTSGTQNNGKITSQSDAISGEQLAYTYDALNRLASAQTTQTGGTQWGQSYTYDGFGNLTDQTVIKGSAPDVHVAYNASNNRQTGDTADANGNIGSGYIYDLDNRLVQPGSSSTVHYGYDVGNKRVWRGDSSSGLDEIAFWAGQKLATYQLSSDSSFVYFALTSTNVSFGGKLISKGTYNSSGTGDKVTLAPIVADHQGSIKKFYPFGTERPSATANDTEKFTGYYRDASTGLDYADQRYHQPGVGRFMSPDPFDGSAKAITPGSWNRYAYVLGDPVNSSDPTGLDGDCDGTDWLGGAYGDYCVIDGDPADNLQINPQTVSVSDGNVGDTAATGDTTPADIGFKLTIDVNGNAEPPATKPSRTECAATFGMDHSIAALWGGQNSAISSLFFGNSVSGILNLGRSLTRGGAPPNFARMVAGGAALGVPVNDALNLAGRPAIPGLTSAVGAIRGAGLRALFNTATEAGNIPSIAAEAGEIAMQGGITAAEYASGAAIAKIGFDAATVLYGYFFTCQGN